MTHPLKDPNYLIPRLIAVVKLMGWSAEELICIIKDRWNDPYNHESLRQPK